MIASKPKDVYKRQVSHCYDRLQSLSFCASQQNALRKLYPNDDDYQEALQRHLQFFNTAVSYTHLDVYKRQHINHLKALIKKAKEDGVKEVRIHALLDGRDVPETSALIYIEDIENYMAELNDDNFHACIASGGGRMTITDVYKRQHNYRS